ncbi:MAG TPA: hypoxanthine-guanine phosphoribosyltransferase [Gammaproteobacteria bacterium]|nr:hypoxanthine-guanine phosphoribosyltransferase [Gammaproteobacteria bacterium]
MTSAPVAMELQQVLQDAELLHDAATVRLALDRMAAEISTELADAHPVVLCVLTGGIIPAGHLLTRLTFPLELDYLHATRYRGATRGEQVQWVCRPGIPLEGRTVLIVDDILDEGHTLVDILEFCHDAGAPQVYSAVLVEKQHARRAGTVTADFTGVHVTDRYVFGFGMDYKGHFRNLDGIYAVRAG